MIRNCILNQIENLIWSIEIENFYHQLDSNIQQKITEHKYKDPPHLARLPKKREPKFI